MKKVRGKLCRNKKGHFTRCRAGVATKKRRKASKRRRR